LTSDLGPLLRTRGALLIGLVVPLLALVPLGRILAEWWHVQQTTPEVAERIVARGADWVRWADEDGQIVARYVFPRGPAAEAGIQAWDRFLSIEGQILFDAADLERTVAGAGPGARLDYEVVRAGVPRIVTVTLTRHPTFLYPFSPGLWAFALWGFVVGAFLHVVGIVVAYPLARQSARARFALWLIGVSALWIFSNLARLLLVELFGPPGRPGGPSDTLFQALTVTGLTGWILFPALLFYNAQTLVQGGRARWAQWGGFLPPLVLGLLAFLTTTMGAVGPLTLNGLVAPLLIYSGVYIAGAAALPLLGRRDGTLPGGFSRRGTVITLAVASVAALSVFGIVPLAQQIERLGVGWLVVMVQLLSVAPVVLVAQATLRYGKLDDVLTRALMLLMVVGLFFFALVGSLSLLRPAFQSGRASLPVVAGLLGVGLFLAFERLLRRFRQRPPRWFATERQRVRERVAAFQERMQTFLDPDSLATATVRTASEAVGARSAALYYRLPGAGEWRTARFQPEPPFLTGEVVSALWPHISTDGRIWARRAELREHPVPPEIARRFEQLGAQVAVPVVGEGGPMGMLVLAARRPVRAVYTLDDLDLLRSLTASFGLALERLALIEREKELARQQAEARLEALRAQINPHFLFNALNTIAAYIEEQPGQAEAAVEHLSSIFRHTLRTASAATVPLAEELDLVRHYLAIEQLRFGARLRVVEALAPGLDAAPVPAFVLQTLVENAVKHGLEGKRGPGTLTIAVRRDNGALLLSVTDDGVGIPALFSGEAADGYFGIGLNNVHDRLARLYHGAAYLHLKSAPEEGTTAEMRIPLPDTLGEGYRLSAVGVRPEAASVPPTSQ
jgi:two-component system, LytTR family, sensor kinase